MSDTQALLIDAKQAAALTACGLRTWRRWSILGRVPRSYKVGGRVLWRMQDVRDWVAAGCPSRDEFEAMRESA